MRSGRSLKRLGIGCIFSLLLIFLISCKEVRIREERLLRTDAVSGEEDVVEFTRVRADGGAQVQQNIVIKSEPADAVQLHAVLDEQGFAKSASFRWEGHRGKRYVEMIPPSDHNAPRRNELPAKATTLISIGDRESLELPPGPIVLWDLVHHLRAPAGVDVVMVDLRRARFAKAQSRGPGIAPEINVPTPTPTTPADPVLPAHTRKEPFVESASPAVIHFAKMRAAGDDAVRAARHIAEAVIPKLSEKKAHGPYSSLHTLTVGAGDEGGTALLVAALRALQHPARAVHATKRTWVQVHDGVKWIDVDPTTAAMTAPEAEAREGFRMSLHSGVRSSAVQSPSSRP